MADETTPPPASVPQPVARTPPIAIWSLVLRLARHRDPRRHLRPYCSFEDSQIQRRARRERSRHRWANLRLHRTRARYNGHPVTCQHDPVGSRALHRLSTERKEIASDDGQIKVTVPGLWTKLPELNKQASLQVGNKSKEVYLIVITDTKADFDNMTLEKHHDLTRDRMFQKMKNASATEPVPLTIDDHPALQDELTGTENGTNVVFLHTTVDDGDHFQQILAWTLKSRWQQQNQLLREITRTFRSEK